MVDLGTIQVHPLVVALAVSVLLNLLILVPAWLMGKTTKDVLDWLERPLEPTKRHVGVGPYPNSFVSHRSPIWDCLEKRDFDTATRLIKSQSTSDLFVLSRQIPRHLSHLWDKYELWYSSVWNVRVPRYFLNERYEISFGQEWQRLSKEDQARVELWQILRSRILDELYARPDNHYRPSWLGARHGT